MKVGPRQAKVRKGREHRRRCREQIVRGRLLEPAAEDGVAEELRATLTAEERQVCVTQVTRPPAERQRVEGDDDRGVSRSLCPLDEARADLAVVDPVELEPARCIPHYLCDLLDRVRG